jgi:hypothetical protein
VIERVFMLARLSVALSENARRLAEQGELNRAMRSLALADALQHAAGGDKVGKKLALQDAKTHRKAERREKNV